MPGGKSVMSDPLDGHITFEALFNALTNWQLLFPDSEVIRVSEKEVLITGKDGLETSEGTQSFEFNRETGQITRVHKVLDVFQKSLHTHIHRDPMRMEVWAIDMDGKRSHDKSLAAYQEQTVNDLIINHGSSWFSWL